MNILFAKCWSECSRISSKPRRNMFLKLHTQWRMFRSKYLITLCYAVYISRRVNIKFTHSSWLATFRVFNYIYRCTNNSDGIIFSYLHSYYKQLYRDCLVDEDFIHIKNIRDLSFPSNILTCPNYELVLKHKIKIPISGK